MTMIPHEPPIPLPCARPPPHSHRLVSIPANTTGGGTPTRRISYHRHGPSAGCEASTKTQHEQKRGRECQARGPRKEGR